MTLCNRLSDIGMNRFKDNEGKLCELHDSNGRPSNLSVYLFTKEAVPNSGDRLDLIHAERFCHHVLHEGKEKIFDASLYTPIFIDTL